jgi:hypothetical protein
MVVLKSGNASCTCCCNWSPWEPPTSSYCLGTSFQQTRYDINGVCPSETRSATGTSTPQWSTWQPDASQVCSGVIFQQTRYDIRGVCPSETRPSPIPGTGAIGVTLTEFKATGGTVSIPQGPCIIAEKTITGPEDENGNTPVTTEGKCQSTSGDCQGCTDYTINGFFKWLGASLISSNPIAVRIHDYYGFIDSEVTIGAAPTQPGTYTYPVNFNEDRPDASGSYTGNVKIQVTCG